MPKRISPVRGFNKENAMEMYEKAKEPLQQFFKDPVKVALRTQKSRLTRKINKELDAYKERLEKRVARLDKIYERIEKELNSIPVGQMPAAFLDIALRYAKQLHEAQLGKPKQQNEVKSDLPITLVIQEEPEPLEIEYREVSDHPVAIIEELEEVKQD
jgi:hypothetical protein